MVRGGRCIFPDCRVAPLHGAESDIANRENARSATRNIIVPCRRLSSLKSLFVRLLKQEVEDLKRYLPMLGLRILERWVDDFE